LAYTESLSILVGYIQNTWNTINLSN